MFIIKVYRDKDLYLEDYRFDTPLISKAKKFKLLSDAYREAKKYCNKGFKILQIDKEGRILDEIR